MFPIHHFVLRFLPSSFFFFLLYKRRRNPIFAPYYIIKKTVRLSLSVWKTQNEMTLLTQRTRGGATTAVREERRHAGAHLVRHTYTHRFIYQLVLKGCINIVSGRECVFIAKPIDMSNYPPALLLLDLYPSSQRG